MLIAGTFLFCLLIAVPIFVCLGVAAAVAMLASPIPMTTLAHSLFTGVDQFPLLAIPCFVLAGAIMARGGITEEIVAVMKALVGRAYGGLAIVTILSCMFFAAISGSGPGTVAAIGSILIPAMKSQGYDEDYAASVASAGGTLGILIPPSNPMIIYGVLASVSIGDMFLAGILPGMLIGALLMATAYLIARRNGFRGMSQRVTGAELAAVAWSAKFSLAMPVIVLGGIYLGVFTPVEASVMAVLYALAVSVILKRRVGIREFWSALGEASAVCGGLVIIMGTAIFLGQFLALNQIPQRIAATMLEITTDPLVFLIIIAILLIILGTFMETLSTVIILTPILMPLVHALGIDPIHFGIVLVVTSEIGFLTPPLGVNLFVACNITGRTIEQVSVKVLPFVGALVVGLIILILFPSISLIVPKGW